MDDKQKLEALPQATQQILRWQAQHQAWLRWLVSTGWPYDWTGDSPPPATPDEVALAWLESDGEIPTPAAINEHLEAFAAEVPDWATPTVPPEPITEPPAGTIVYDTAGDAWQRQGDGLWYSPEYALPLTWPAVRGRRR